MKLKNIFAGALVLAGSVVALASCDSSDSNSSYEASTKAEIKETFTTKSSLVSDSDDTVSFTDANGTEFNLTKNPDNITVLYASYTTLLYEAGGVATGVVGGSSAKATYTEYIGRDITTDEGVNVVASSPAGKTWNTETIMATNPDVVFCATVMSGYSTISGACEAAGVPCVAIDYNDFADYLKWFKVFYELTSTSESEDLWTNVALEALDDVADVIYETNNSDLESDALLSLFSGTSTFQVNTRNVLVGSMIEALGGDNIATSWGETTEERLTLDVEKIYASHPKKILIQCHADEEDVKALMDSLYGENAVWQAIIEEVGEDNIIYLSKSLFQNKPNRKFALAYQTLAQHIYPDHTFSFTTEE